VKISSRYRNGQYLEKTKTWHLEDSPWKAEQIEKIIVQNSLRPSTVGEIGCGAGGVIKALSERPYFDDVEFSGYEISPQAYEMAKAQELGNTKYYLEDLHSDGNSDFFDILLVIDVFEHVPDYLGFLSKCRTKADYKIYHIPLDIHVSSVIRNSFVKGRESVGHLHYFVADSATASLVDSGHEIIDMFYTNASFGLFWQHPSINKALANIPRWVFSRISVPLTARLFGGYSLLVLAR
jgi:SAM-dependent methyltransferase